ncbi:hypothetical protein OH76DRAFT_1421025 [Lentinus brumalis]|uniref:Uncharacterized protein n=1 Tax=Lentinus brumalis TaxID=2498619 RepID=A0A371CXN1_9APHY|nr:hypothetical protein OH76DRAFT_1421025 [Polyporus brumalis]
MSNNQKAPPADAVQTDGSALRRTQSGAIVFVEATPPPGSTPEGQQGQNDAPPLIPGSPLIINDTFDLLTPPGLPPPSTAAARRRTPLAERDVCTVERESLRIIRDDHPLQTPPAPPATQLPRRTPLSERNVNALDGACRSGQMSGALAGTIPISELRDAQSREGGNPWIFPRARRGRVRLAAATTVQTAAEASLDSSPLSFSWDATTATLSPSIRAAETRAHAISAVAATAHETDDNANIAEALTTAPLAGETGEPVLTSGTARQAETTKSAGASGQADGDADDYFRFFTTPVLSAEAPNRDTQTFNNREARQMTDDEGNPIDADAADHGEPARDFFTQDNPRTARKRIWMGTPDPEAEQRHASRMRMAGSTPAMRSSRKLPNTLISASSRNPWADDGAAGRRERSRGVDNFSFVPVASSPPPVRPVSRPSQTQQRTQTNSSDLIAAPRPGHIAHGPPEHLLPLLSGAHAWPEPGRAREAQSGRQSRMEVDVPAHDHDSPTPEPSQKRKGKARALTADLSHSEHRHDVDPAQTAVHGWNEADILEARQQSLRTARDGGPYIPQTNGAGPSRTLHEQRDTLGSPFSLSRTVLRDDHPPSRARHDGSRFRHAPRSIEARLEADDPFRNRFHEGLSSTHYEGCARSEFLPLPNMRAAHFIANRGSCEPREHPLQRSPYSRLHDRNQSRTRSPTATFRRTPWSAAGQMTGLEAQREDTARPVSMGQQDLMEGEGSRPPERIMDEGEGDDEFLDAGDDDASAQEGEREAGWGLEDGEVLPTALRERAGPEDAAPTPVPNGGFPTIHRDDPETALRGMAVDWIREVWSDAPNTDVLVQIYNYRYTEDDILNGRIADALRHAFEQLSGEQGFDVVPPEPEDGSSRRQRDLPSIWVIRGLSPRGTLHATRRGFWSFPYISFAALPRAMPSQEWLFTLEGFLEGNEDKIRAAVLRVLREEGIQQWMAEMVSDNPGYEGRSTRRALEEIYDSLRVETMQLSNGTYIANVFIRSPTRNVKEWRRWVAELRSRRYRSFSIGTGRVRYISPCSGCTSVSHPVHLCPFPRIAGWNGPEPGDGVFGERRERREGRPLTAHGPMRRGAGSCQGTGQDGRNGGTYRGPGPQQGPPGDRGRNERGERYSRNDRGGQDSRSGRGAHNSRNGRNDRFDRNDRNQRDDRSDRDPSRKYGGGGGANGFGNGKGRRNF